MLRQDTTGRICRRPEIPRKGKIWLPASFSHSSSTDSKEPQNALLLIVVQGRSFPREPILLYSTGLINNIIEEPPRSTGLLGRPQTCTCNSRESSAILQANLFVSNSRWVFNVLGGKIQVVCAYVKMGMHTKRAHTYHEVHTDIQYNYRLKPWLQQIQSLLCIQFYADRGSVLACVHM